VGVPPTSFQSVDDMWPPQRTQASGAKRRFRVLPARFKQEF
jgi:hypothetical protein